MEAIFNWGANIVLWMQQFSPALDPPFKVFTFLGSEDFFIILLPLVYWCLDRKTGGRLLILFMFSSYFGALAKVVLHQPRPFTYDPRVKMLVTEVSYGFPSLHTQNTTVIWVYLAAVMRKRWLWITAAVLLVLVPLSRVYLGVHFPTDLVGGYLFGAILVLLGLWLDSPLDTRLGRLNLGWQIGLAVLASSLMLALFPTADETALVTSALILGVGSGMAIERRWVGFESGGSAGKQALRFALGMVTTILLRFGLKAAFAGFEQETVFHFLRYSILGIWCGLGAPWFFVRFKLANSRIKPAS